MPSLPKEGYISGMVTHMSGLQASQFGAFIDVAADNFSRAAILTAAVGGAWPAALITLEGLTFACTNTVCLLAWVYAHMTSLKTTYIESCELASA